VIWYLFRSFFATGNKGGTTEGKKGRERRFPTHPSSYRGLISHVVAHFEEKKTQGRKKKRRRRRRSFPLLYEVQEKKEKRKTISLFASYTNLLYFITREKLKEKRSTNAVDLFPHSSSAGKRKKSGTEERGKETEQKA